MELNERRWEERGLRDAVLAGDEAAWQVLYDRCFAPLYAYIHRRTGGHAQRTEEAMQECWMVAVRRIAKFDPDRAAFATWMRGIAENVLRNRWRRWRRDQTETSCWNADRAGYAPDPRHQVVLAEEVALALAALPARYEAVLRAKYEEQLHVAEIAARWGDSPKAVESLLVRARAAFRKAYVGLDTQTE